MSTGDGSYLPNKYVHMVVKPTKLKDGRVAYYGKDSKQAFNIYMKQTEEVRNDNYREQIQGCQIPISYNEREGTTYGYGEQKVHLHDEITTIRVTATFTNLSADRNLAVYRGLVESAEEKTDSKEKCRLNINNN
jgi:hypothetical protein